MTTPKRFCPRGHDTWVTGRYSSYRCKICAREGARLHELTFGRSPMSEESKAKARERERVWRAARPEKVRAYNRKYRQQPHAKAVARQSQQAWYIKNRQYVNQKHAARMWGIPPISKALAEELLAYYGSECVYCGAPATGFDHLEPVSKGGATDFYNLAPACKSCNSSKHNRPLWTMVA